MAGIDWERIQEIFLEAAELPDGMRQEFLAVACGDDSVLRLEVESLLNADTAGTSSLEKLIGVEVDALVEDLTSLSGSRLGPYVLLEPIGRGGMGSVYLAKRDDAQFQKMVAIKVVRSGMDTAEVLARFRHERQILAHLEHPYIARLLDGGTTPDGKPFLVMEYVKGRPINVYCELHRLSLQERLRLFLRVCESVSFAHRALVVHRDLKPSNILVSEDGSPKLLDFGVAKLLDDSTSIGLTSAAHNAAPLTPEYASPEQVRGETITTASDVYALGAILFELITGRQAQEIGSRTPSEIERAVCNRETSRPSDVARQSNSSIHPDRDLDNIVLMAMRKEPERRYESVTRLADDVARYLAGRPVHARGSSIGYRSRKFIRRHWIQVTAAAIVAISLVTGTAVALKQARRAEEQREIAESQRRAAVQERIRAEAEAKEAGTQRQLAEDESVVAKREQDLSQKRLNDMLDMASQSLFDLNNSIQKLQGSTTARQQLVDTTLKYLEKLSANAGDNERLQYILSVSYLRVADVLGYPLEANLGDTKGALANYEKSSKFIVPLVKRYPRNGNYMQQLVDVEMSWGITLAHGGDEQRGMSMLQQALTDSETLQKLCPKDKLTRCWMTRENVYSDLSEVEHEPGQQLRYTALQVEVGEEALKAAPKDREIQLEVATAHSQYAKALNRVGKLREAVDQFRQAIALRESVMSESELDASSLRNLMISYGNLGGTLGNPLYFNLGDTEGARENYGKALVIARRLAKADPNNSLAQYDLANALLYFAVLPGSADRIPEQLAALRESEAIMNRALAENPQALSTLRTLAMIQEFQGRRLQTQGRTDEALEAFRKSLDSAEKCYQKTPTALSALAQLLASEDMVAQTLATKGDRTAALEMAQREVALAQQSKMPESEAMRRTRYVAGALSTLANVQAKFEQWQEARATAQTAAELWHKLGESTNHLLDAQKIAMTDAVLAECAKHLN